MSTQPYNHQLFDHWAPPGGLWTPWAKPVLFTQIGPDVLAEGAGRWAEPDVAWAPPVAQGTAVVVDLAGPTSVYYGIALAQRGYRPVPLYNCCAGPAAVLDVRALLAALATGGHVLDDLNLPYDAPPAFLLDSRRQGLSARPSPGTFDNRWVTLPQDFPSVNFLRSQGIGSALYVQDQFGQPRGDLAHVLRRWQEADLRVSCVGVTAHYPDAHAMPIDVRRPSHFRGLWYTLLATLGLRRSAAGGFGSLVPMPSQGGRRYG